MKTLDTEDFRIISTGWEEQNGIKTNPEGDVWEKDGNQYFTWDAAMRETWKVGKRIPTKDEWREIINEDVDIRIAFSGSRYFSDGSFYNQGLTGYYWSSSPYASNLTLAHYVYFSATSGTIAPYYNRAYGFSVRCLKNLGDESNQSSEQVDDSVSDSSSLGVFTEVIERLKEKKNEHEVKAKEIQNAIDIISSL